MEYACGTDRGVVRGSNEDSVCIKELPSGALLVIVADGMGGHNCGEVASGIAVKIITEYLEENFENPNKEFLLTESIKSANFKILQKAKMDNSCDGMGTTVTAALIYGKNVCIANVGDSRAYIIRRNTITQITNDHSMVNELLKKGIITPDEAVNHPHKNVITRAVGTDEQVAIDTFSFSLLERDILLLCSDGLSNMLTDEEIKVVIKGRQRMETRISRLITFANGKGGTDNISVAAVNIKESVGENKQ